MASTRETGLDSGWLMLRSTEVSLSVTHHLPFSSTPSFPEHKFVYLKNKVVPSDNMKNEQKEEEVEFKEGHVSKF
nr:hypothetical protein CFP56_58445 [Quercus suber]